MTIRIKTTDLTKTYGALVAVSGLSLKIRAGEIFGLLGPNGAGKTTTLLMLAGLIKPTEGTIAFFGKELPKARIDISRRVGVMTEQPAFYGQLSARQNLALLAKLAGREVNIDRVLDQVGLLRNGHVKVKGYSHGMRQRLGLAQALLGDPDVLLLDEPTNGLDPEATRDILKLLRRLSRKNGATIMFSSHLLHEVETLCDRVAILNRGRLLACEETNTLVSYDTTEVEVLIDSPDAAVRRLQDEPWVENAVAHSGRIAVKLSTGTVHQLTSLLISAGYRVSGVIPRQRNLQDYFLKVLNQ